MSLHDAGLLTIAITVIGIGLAGIVMGIRDNAFQAGYWKGRGDGWRLANRHRDLIVNVKDEVFDYEKQN
jgi:predicted membrane chloride channel (bestrophin family)